MSNAINKAREEGVKWAKYALMSGNDRTFVQTGKVSSLMSGIMTKSVRASGVTRSAIEQAFMDAAEDHWKQVHEIK